MDAIVEDLNELSEFRELKARVANLEAHTSKLQQDVDDLLRSSPSVDAVGHEWLLP